MYPEILNEAIARKVETANIKVFVDRYSRAYFVACSHFVHRNLFIRGWNFMLVFSQSAITCSKLTIEALEQGVKYVQS